MKQTLALKKKMDVQMAKLRRQEAFKLKKAYKKHKKGIKKLQQKDKDQKGLKAKIERLEADKETLKEEYKQKLIDNELRATQAFVNSAMSCQKPLPLIEEAYDFYALQQEKDASPAAEMYPKIAKDL